MFNGRFQILLRKRQNTFEGNNVIVQCDPITEIAQYVPGTVDNTWYDFTNYIENAERMSFTWDKVNSGNSTNSQTNPEGSNYDKGISSDLMFFDSAYQFIYDWLLSTDCQLINSIEVKIIDLIADGTYRIFEIKNDNIEYAPIDEPCQFSIKLREQDPVWHCIHKTFIWDNWQNWFNETGTSVKEHPTFLTCVEPRPRIMNSVRLGFLIFLMGFPSGVQEIIIALSGYDYRREARRILDINNFIPAPLIREYIDNVAGKCGLAVDTIFHRAGTPEYYACIFHPLAGEAYQDDGNGEASPSTLFLFANRWDITIAELFDKLKTLYCAEWYVTPDNTIIFKPVKELISLLPIYDFTLPDAEPIYGLRYTFNGDKKAAYGRYQYGVDGSDLGSQEVSNLYNDIVDYDGPAFNPMLEGEKTKQFEFAPTAFVRDGRSADYIEQLTEDGRIVAIALLGIVAVATIYLIGGITTWIAAGIALAIILTWIGQINFYRDNILDNFAREGTNYTGAVRLVTANQTMTPRVIVWDGVSPLARAKTVKTNSPEPNAYYNPTYATYTSRNAINNDNPLGNIYNYPMYFDSEYEDNLFDRFHDEIDNPLKSKESNQDVKWYVDLCEDMLNLFGVFENQYAVIGKIVKLEERENYTIFARIGNINVDYGTNQINLRGKVIRRKTVPVVNICDTFEINARCLTINEKYLTVNG